MAATAINNIKEIAQYQLENSQQQVAAAIKSQVEYIEGKLDFIKRQLQQYQEVDDQSKQSLASGIHSELVALRNIGIENYLSELNGSMKLVQGIQYAIRNLNAE